MTNNHDIQVDTKSIVEKTLEVWPTLTAEEQIAQFLGLPREEEDEVFLRLNAQDQAHILSQASSAGRRAWMRILAPDDAADVIQERPKEERVELLDLLDSQTRMEVYALLAYREDEAGGLMSPRFARLRPDMSVEEAIRYLRAQTQHSLETIYYAYALAPDQKLLGVVSLHQLFRASSDQRVENIMVKGTKLITVKENMNQEKIARLFSKWEFLALPVVDRHRHMKGIVTVNDVVGIVQEEASEDIQKFGGMAALDAPYLQIGFLPMVKKRAGWLLILFVGEMFTATAMGYYQMEIERAVVLALFIPLIISSGGNSGSQASTLMIRAMALGEVRLKDWWRILRREISSGLALGCILGFVGLCRITLWPTREKLYGEHYVLVGLAVSASLIGVVLWGTLAGSMLPFLLRRLKFDPAAASAPFVATLVDVTGLIIYFTMASVFLGGVLL